MTRINVIVLYMDAKSIIQNNIVGVNSLALNL